MCWDPGHEHIAGWDMWQKYRHLIREGSGEKVLLPFTACQSSTATRPLRLLGSHPWVSQAAGAPARPACHLGHISGWERSCGSLQRMSEVKV